MMKLLSLTGWLRVALMFACGAAAALSLAPFHIWPLIVPAYGLLLRYLMRAENAKISFRLSWWWGFGFFLTGLYWICISMTVDLPRFGWMIPFALIGLNGGLALFPAAAGWGFHLIQRGNDVMGWLLFALLFFAVDLLRGNILTGFPWNLIGYVWGTNNHAIQAASLLSIYPLTLATILMASSVALWPRRWPAALSAAVLLAALCYGELRLQHSQSYQPDKSIRLVQGNIPQNMKWEAESKRQALEKHISLSLGDVSFPDVIIWSESALPYALEVGNIPPDAFSWLQEGQMLITGAVVLDDGQVSNSIVAVNNKSQIVARYDKQHLVPFGEYVPLRGLLPIDRLTAGIGDFASGQGARDLLGFHPLLCYEIIFPSYAEGEQGVILNLTNDDWFGYSSGPFQHLMAARFRAVEQGKPLIRVANSGITAVIDAYGRVQEHLPLHTDGVIDLK